MGKITYTALAVMFAFFLTTAYLNAMYTASSDATKKQFTSYKEQYPRGDLDQNLSIPNTGDSVTNMQLSAQIMSSHIASSFLSWKSQNFEDKLLGAFGLISAMTLDVGGLLLAVLVDGFDFVAGIAFNLSTTLPPEFTIFATLGAFGMALFVVYIVFRIASALTGRDI